MKKRGMVCSGMVLALLGGGLANVWAQTPTPAPAMGAAPVATPPAEAEKNASGTGLFIGREQVQALMGGVTANDVQAPGTPPDMPDFAPSYGTIDTSVLFSDDAIVRMKEELDRVERLLATGAITPDAATEMQESTPEVKPVVAIPFQAYHVASIVYRSPADWMVWLNGKRVTPKRNEGPVRVVGVGPDSVRLVWSPEDWDERIPVWRDKQAPSAEILKIRALDAHTGIDEERRTVTATMRSNQTWVTAYPMIVEGAHPELEISLTPQQGGQPVPQDAGGNTKDALDDIAKRQAQQINANSQKLATEEKPTLLLKKEQKKAAAAQMATPPAAALTAPVPPEVAPLQDRAPTSLNDVLNAIGTDSTKANRN